MWGPLAGQPIGGASRPHMSDTRGLCNKLGFHATKNTSFLKFFLQCVKLVAARSNLS
jgi:hypothetical protein